MNFFYDLFIGKNSYNFSLIAIYYIIKFGGIRQLFKIYNKLFHFCKDESNKKEILIIESLIINKILDKISSLILFFSHYNFLNKEEYYLLLILESDITKKLLY